MHFPTFQITMTMTEKMCCFFLKYETIVITRKGKNQVLLADQTFGEIPADGLGGTKQKQVIEQPRAAKRRAAFQGT